MFPIIPLLALGSMLGGAFTFLWYGGLSAAKKEEADRLACDYARTLFGKQLDRLTSSEARTVYNLTKRHFNAA